MVFVRKNPFFISCILLSALITFTFFHDLPYRFYWDDADYYKLAKHFSKEAFLSNHTFSNIRTYAYPYLLSFIFTENIPQFLNALVFLQWAFYVMASFIFCGLVFEEKNRRYCFAMLTLNPFLLVYACYALTDLIFISCILLAIGCSFKAVCISQLEGLSHSGLKFLMMLLSVAAFSVGLSIVIRPAGVFIIPAFAITCLNIAYKLYFSNSYKRGNLLVLLIGIVAVPFFFILPLMPQIAINVTLFNQWTFLPTSSLGNSQVTWGFQYLKYATNVSGVGAAQIYYPNPFFDVQMTSIVWYFQNPFQASRLLLIKLVGAFHYDYLYPYITNLRTPFYMVTTTFSALIFILGTYGIFTQRKYLATKVVILPSLFFWCAVILPTALELRFGLPIFALLSCYTVIAVRQIYHLPHVLQLKYLMIIFVCYLLFQSIGHFVFMQNSHFSAPAIAVTQ